MALHCQAPTRCSTQCLREKTCLRLSSFSLSPFPFRPTIAYNFNLSKRLQCQTNLRASKAIDLVLGGNNEFDSESENSDSDHETDYESPLLTSKEAREEARRKIREILERAPRVSVETDPQKRKYKIDELLREYSLVVDEEDPDWPEENDEGWGFKFDQFFNKISIKNVKKDDDDENEDYDSDQDIVWKDDDYIKPIREVTASEWEDTVFVDFNPLVILVHNRYRRPRENEKARNELVRAIQMFWDSGLPSPRCVGIDAFVEDKLVDALKITTFPEILFTKAGKILHRDKVVRTAEEWSKIMCFFYYKAIRPPFLDKSAGQNEEKIPSIS